MDIQILADSCCDVTPAMRGTLDLKTIPLKITVDGTKEFVDSPEMSIKQLAAAMKATKKPLVTSAPSPGDYAKEMEQADASVVVTLSHHLSGSYNAAVAARQMVLEQHPDKKIAIFDSKSAAAGETRIVLKLHEMIKGGCSFEEIEQQIPAFIDGMRTFFVVEDLSTLIKNGRIPRMSGMLGTVLMLRPIMGENGDGEIIPLEKVRGTQKALDRMVEMVAHNTAALQAGSLILTMSHCGVPERAAEVKKKLLASCPAVGEVIMAPAGGISYSYANNGGIIIAYA